MLVLLSPAKSLDYDTALPVLDHHTPEFAAQAHELVGLLQPLSSARLGALMHISKALADLNHQRYVDWSRRFTTKNSRPALFAFNGDVYDGLDAYQLTPAQIKWADQHLVILSGLYGALRPLDRMQAYRLEMGTSLSNPLGKDLYAYWRERLTAYLNARLKGGKAPLLVNLASQEYAKAVDFERIAARCIDCVFEDWSSNRWKVVGLFAKRARGRLARYIVENRASREVELQAFDVDGYRFDPEASHERRMVFRRRPTSK